MNGGWSDWSGWSTCPVTCEGTPNNQYRTRSCTSPAQYCGGNHCTDYGESDTSYATCNTMCCPGKNTVFDIHSVYCYYI